MAFRFIDNQTTTQQKKSKFTFVDEDNVQDKPDIRQLMSQVIRPTVDGLLKDAPRRSLSQDLLGVLEGATLGIPRTVTKKTTGIDIPRGSTGGQVVGSFAGLGKLNQLARLLVGKGLIKSGAVTGALASQAPSFTPIDTSSEERIARGTIGAVTGGAAGGAFATGGALFRATAGKIPMLKKIREAMFKAKRDAGKEFSSQLDKQAKNNPDKTIDLFEELSAMQSKEQLNPALKRAIDSNPTLRGLVNNPESGKQLTIRQVQDIKNALSRRITKGKFDGSKDFTESDLDILESLDDVGLAQSKAFPEMLDIRKKFASVANDFKLVRSGAKQGSTERAIEGERFFGGKEQEAALKRLVPSVVFKQAKTQRNIARLPKKVAGPAIGAGVGFGVAGLLSKLLESRQ